MVTVGLFMPLPLAMMIPFMGIQSAVMAKQFGENFQYGKRRISAMSNEEFNKLTPQKIQENANKELKAMIPSMQASVTEMRSFQTFLIREFLLMINDSIRAGIGGIFGFDEKTLSNIEHFIHGHFDLHGDEGSSTTPPPGEEEPTNLLHLTLSQISGANDQVLLSWIQNITDYDAQTQQWLINERERRGQDTVVTPPSEEQINSQLSPEFILSLSKSDLKASGRGRTRNFKGKIMKWIVVRWCSYSATILTVRKFQGSGWVNTNEGRKGININAAIARINELKLQFGVSFVKEFDGRDYFLIKDNF